VVNNFNYGMTGGQFSATTPAESITATTAYGNPEREFNICNLAESAGANYVGRSTIYHGRLLETMLKEALSKKGFSLVEVVSACPTHFGRHNRMKASTDMLKWFKKAGVTKDKYEKMKPEEQENSILIGKLVDKDAPDFNTRYEEVQQKAMGN
jgi:2-oxoglutarate ferredoxin oxidoreductase subunit beta